MGKKSKRRNRSYHTRERNDVTEKQQDDATRPDESRKSETKKTEAAKACSQVQADSSARIFDHDVGHKLSKHSDQSEVAASVLSVGGQDRKKKLTIQKSLHPNPKDGLLSTCSFENAEDAKYMFGGSTKKEPIRTNDSSSSIPTCLGQPKETNKIVSVSRRKRKRLIFLYPATGPDEARTEVKTYIFPKSDEARTEVCDKSRDDVARPSKETEVGHHDLSKETIDDILFPARQKAINFPNDRNEKLKLSKIDTADTGEDKANLFTGDSSKYISEGERGDQDATKTKRDNGQAGGGEQQPEFAPKQIVQSESKHRDPPSSNNGKTASASKADKRRKVNGAIDAAEDEKKEDNKARSENGDNSERKKGSVEISDKKAISLAARWSILDLTQDNIQEAVRARAASLDVQISYGATSVQEAVENERGCRPRSNSTDGELNLPQTGLCDERAVLASHKWKNNSNGGWRLTDHSKKCQPRGLVNMGNTCFLNATLQCLAYLPTFCQCMSSLSPHSVKTNGKGSKGQTFALLMRGLLRRIHLLDVGDVKPKQGPIRPNLIVGQLASLGSGRTRFRLGRQEDAHEFLVHLLDTIHEGELKNAGECACDINSIIFSARLLSHHIHPLCVLKRDRSTKKRMARPSSHSSIKRNNSNTSRFWWILAKSSPLHPVWIQEQHL
jgi:hypothetical protein